MARRGGVPWKNYLVEFLSVFMGVSLAFALSKWNQNIKDDKAERQTLIEIRNGLERDLSDLRENRDGHKRGIQACKYFRKVVFQENVPADSAGYYYYILLRDFVSIQNSSGYESLKSRGMELIDNDSLRLQIASVYDHYYEILEKLEENYSENQFNDNYFQPITSTLASGFIMDEEGSLAGIKLPLQLDPGERKKFLIYLMRIQLNRKFAVEYYGLVENKVTNLMESIEQELAGSK